jgi:hypothetical protein
MTSEDGGEESLSVIFPEVCMRTRANKFFTDQ